jgi:two-component system chemotaxis response regulator CheB
MQNNRLSPVRAVVVDDSPTVRELLVAILQETKDIQVVGTGATGEDAVRLVKRLRPDVVTMDIRMPKMDGVEATRQIMRECPTPIVVISSSVKRAEMDLTFQALQAGALTAINTPGLDDADNCANVIQTVRLMAGVPVIHHWGRLKSPQPSTDNMVREEVKRPTPQVDIDIQQMEIDIIGMAASTGGPSALATVLRNLPADFPIPILIVQHVSPGFAGGLAEWLSTQTVLSVDVAAYGDTILSGVVLISPDDYHLQVSERGVVELSRGPCYKGLRPSANYLFSSLARVYGPRAMGVLLTGMGDDGADGMEALHQAGGFTIAQDEESCVVYGMPREAIARNAIDQVLTLEQIASAFGQLAPSTQIVQ